jgi:hypothetical protein
VSESDSTEEVAERLAAHGRDALVERLRTAFADAAEAHADIVSIDSERLEALVQRSVDRADGLQWRRALAGVASEQLGIGLTEALRHPAVVRAQELVGAPSYEQSLAELIKRPGPTADEPDEPDEPDDEALKLTAIHLGGVANLPGSAEEVDLRLSGDGLDIARGGDEILGRLSWSEIDALEVPTARGRRRRQPGRARLIVRTGSGDASFEIPALSSDELLERIQPLLARYGRG